MSLHRSLPNELNSMIICQLPLQSLLQIARACVLFQIEAEVHIYRTIKVRADWANGLKLSTFKRALFARSMRQNLVQEIVFDFATMTCENGPRILEFMLTTLPNIKSLFFPSSDEILVQKPFKTQSQLDERCRKQSEKHAHSSDLAWRFLASQASVRILRAPFDVSKFVIANDVLPHLEEVVCKVPILSVIAPGRPVRKVRIVEEINLHELQNHIIPSLLKSTAPLTKLEIRLRFATPNTLEMIARTFPHLEYLEIIDGGDRWPIEMQNKLLAWMPHEHQDSSNAALEAYIYHDPSSRVYPHFTRHIVNTLLAPLSQLPELRHFTLIYNWTKEGDKYPVHDISEALEWRDAATPNLAHVQLHHVELCKDGDGSWTQRDATHWREHPWMNDHQW